MKQFIKHPSVKSITVYRESDGEGLYWYQINNEEYVTASGSSDPLVQVVQIERILKNPSFGGQMDLDGLRQICSLQKLLTINYK